MQILLSTGAAFKTHTLKETEQMAVQLGYAGLELMPVPLHHAAGEAKRDDNYASLTQVPVMHAIGDVYDQNRFRAALDASVMIAQQNHIPVINIHPASAAFGGRQNVIDGIEYLKKVEQQTGLTITYELLVDPEGVHPDRRDWFTQQQAYTSIEAWLDDVVTYNLSATIDTCHAGTWRRDPAEVLQLVGNHLQHVHFSDFDTIQKQEHILPGTGHVLLAPFVQLLNQNYPDITVTIEIDPVDDKELVEQRAKQSLAYIQQAIAH